MASVLVTGSSGTLGRLLVVAAAAAGHEVIAMSRKSPEAAVAHRFIGGNFSSFEDLRQLDKLNIDVVVHLAAEVGGCAEEAGIETNVAGTRRLVRYLLDRGTRRFILASSIAATGCLHGDFVAQRLPIPDDHPCIARDMYGLSKAMMEQLLSYFANTSPGASFVALRIGAVLKAARRDKPRKAGAFPPNPFLQLGYVIDADVIAGILCAVAAPPKPGLHLYNLVGPDAAADDPVAEIIARLQGPNAALDTSWYAAPGREFAPLYDMRKIKGELGFTPRHSLR